MKLSYQIIVLLITFFGTVSYGQSQIAPEQLVGVWTLDYETSFSSIQEQQKARLEAMPKEQRVNIETSYKGRKLEILSDGVYMLMLVNGRQSQGTWVCNPVTNMLEITHLNGKTTYQKIKILSANKLVLVPEMERNYPILIPELHYIKN